MKTQSYTVEDVFTPSAPPVLTFVDRDITVLLEGYMREHSRPICLEGPFQAGKTSLVLRAANAIFPNGPIHVVCTEDSTVESLIKKAFQILRPYYHSEVVREQSKVPITFVKSLFGSGGASDKQHDPMMTKSIPLPTGDQTSLVLAMFSADARRPFIIDDAHKLAKEEIVRLARVAREWQSQVGHYGYPKIIIIGSHLGYRIIVRIINPCASQRVY